MSMSTTRNRSGAPTFGGGVRGFSLGFREVREVREVRVWFGQTPEGVGIECRGSRITGSGSEFQP